MATKRNVTAAPRKHRFVCINNVVVTGHLTHDPELKYTKDGTPCLDFQIGVRSSGPGARSHFVTVCVFGSMAVTCSKLRKGLPVVIEGEIRDSVRKFGAIVQRRAKIWARRVHRMTEDQSAADELSDVPKDAHSKVAPRKRVARKTAVKASSKRPARARSRVSKPKETTENVPHAQ